MQIREKTLYFGNHGREGLLKGVQHLCNIVQLTLGPSGQCVLLDRPLSAPRPTKDGVTIAQEIFLKDEIENLGAQLVKEAALGAGKVAGDGTTTATVLAGALIEELLDLRKSEEKSFSLSEINKFLDEEEKKITEFLQSHTSPLNSSEQAVQIATIAANGDAELGWLIGTIHYEVGAEGLLTVKHSYMRETFFEHTNGWELDAGMLSSVFINNPATRSCDLSNCRVLLCKGAVNLKASKAFQTVLGALFDGQTLGIGESLVVVADDYAYQIVDMVMELHKKHKVPICLIKAPAYGENRICLIEDLACLTGGAVIDLAKLPAKWKGEGLGTLETCTSNQVRTIFLTGGGNRTLIEQREQEIAQELALERTKQDSSDTKLIEFLERRLANFCGGIAVIKVGGETEQEVQEKADRIDDAIRAVKAGLKSGFVPGGGISLLNYAGTLPTDTYLYQMLRRVLSKPFQVICKNAGYDPETLLKNMIQSSLPLAVRGIDARKGAVVDMFECGIIDPLLVVETTIHKAFSVAKSVMSIEGVLLDSTDYEKAHNAVHHYISAKMKGI